MYCTAVKCRQQVLSAEEQNKRKPLCYFHAKVRDKLISSSNDYTIVDFDYDSFMKITETIFRGQGKFKKNRTIKEMAYVLYENYNINRSYLIDDFASYYLASGLHSKYNDSISTINTYITNAIYYYLLTLLKTFGKERELIELSNAIENYYIDQECESQESALINKETIDICKNHIVNKYGKHYYELFVGDVTQGQMVAELEITRQAVNKRLNKIINELKIKI